MNPVSLGAESALRERHWLHRSLQAEPVAAVKATRKRTSPTEGWVVVSNESPGDESYGQCCKKTTTNPVTVVGSNCRETSAD